MVKKKLRIFHLFICQVVIGQLIIGQFNNPITFKVACAYFCVLLAPKYRYEARWP